MRQTQLKKLFMTVERNEGNEKYKWLEVLSYSKKETKDRTIKDKTIFE